MKHEWKKHEKDLYAPKQIARLLTVPNQKFFMIKGVGNPNDVDFAERIGVLYSLAYAVRMMPKSGYIPDGYFEYTVYPLEGIWKPCNVTDKSTYVYTLMIRQPNFVIPEIAQKALEIATKKKPHPLLKETFFAEMEDGLSVQILHLGDYDNEPLSFAKIYAYMHANKLVRNATSHREIYLSDARKVNRDKLKTVLRYTVREI